MIKKCQLFCPLARTQPIIVNATTEMLTTDILPVAQKLKEQARNMAKEEESFQQRKRTRHADGEDTSTIQEVIITTYFLYLTYPLLLI